MQDQRIIRPLGPFRTIHKVDLEITPQPAGVIPRDKVTFQVVNASNSLDAVTAAQQYVANLGKWEFDDYGEHPVQQTDLLEVVRLWQLDPHLLSYRTLVCSPPAKRRVVYEECTREESLHDDSGCTRVWISDGLETYRWLAGDENDYGTKAVKERRMMYVRPAAECQKIVPPKPPTAGTLVDAEFVDPEVDAPTTPASAEEEVFF